MRWESFYLGFLEETEDELGNSIKTPTERVKRLTGCFNNWNTEDVQLLRDLTQITIKVILRASDIGEVDDIDNIYINYKDETFAVKKVIAKNSRYIILAIQHYDYWGDDFESEDEARGSR